MLNPTYRVSRSMSSRINQLIRDKEFTSVIDLLDYSIKELMIHLEKRFRDGMNWDNYGPYWHIDHIKPVSHFKFKSKNDFEFKECWALSNLQPLLKSENLSKGNRYIGWTCVFHEGNKAWDSNATENLKKKPCRDFSSRTMHRFKNYQIKVNFRFAIRSNRKDRQPMRSSAPQSGIFHARKPTTRPLSFFLLTKRCFVGRKTL